MDFDAKLDIDFMYECEECGQVFATAHGLGSHRRVHKPSLYMLEVIDKRRKALMSRREAPATANTGSMAPVGVPDGPRTHPTAVASLAYTPRPPAHRDNSDEEASGQGLAGSDQGAGLRKRRHFAASAPMPTDSPVQLSSPGAAQGSPDSACAADDVHAEEYSPRDAPADFEDDGDPCPAWDGDDERATDEGGDSSVHIEFPDGMYSIEALHAAVVPEKSPAYPRRLFEHMAVAQHMSRDRATDAIATMRTFLRALAMQLRDYVRNRLGSDALGSATAWMRSAVDLPTTGKALFNGIQTLANTTYGDARFHEVKVSLTDVGTPASRRDAGLGRELHAWVRRLKNAVKWMLMSATTILHCVAQRPGSEQELFFSQHVQEAVDDVRGRAPSASRGYVLPVPLVVYTDDTTLNGYGSRSVLGITISCANLPHEERYTDAGMLLLAYLVRPKNTAAAPSAGTADGGDHVTQVQPLSAGTKRRHDSVERGAQADAVGVDARDARTKQLRTPTGSAAAHSAADRSPSSMMRMAGSKRRHDDDATHAESRNGHTDSRAPVRMSTPQKTQDALRNAAMQKLFGAALWDQLVELSNVYIELPSSVLPGLFARGGVVPHDTVLLKVFPSLVLGDQVGMSELLGVAQNRCCMCTAPRGQLSLGKPRSASRAVKLYQRLTNPESSEEVRATAVEALTEDMGMKRALVEPSILRLGQDTTQGDGVTFRSGGVLRVAWPDPLHALLLGVLEYIVKDLVPEAVRAGEFTDKVLDQRMFAVRAFSFGGSSRAAGVRWRMATSGHEIADAVTNLAAVWQMPASVELGHKRYHVGMVLLRSVQLLRMIRERPAGVTSSTDAAALCRECVDGLMMSLRAAVDTLSGNGAFDALAQRRVKLHTVHHFPDAIQRCGSLAAVSTEPFERYNKLISTKVFRNTNGKSPEVEKQLSQRMHEYDTYMRLEPAAESIVSVRDAAAAARDVISRGEDDEHDDVDSEPILTLAVNKCSGRMSRAAAERVCDTGELRRLLQACIEDRDAEHVLEHSRITLFNNVALTPRHGAKRTPVVSSGDFVTLLEVPAAAAQPAPAAGAARWRVSTPRIYLVKAIIQYAPECAMRLLPGAAECNTAAFVVLRELAPVAAPSASVDPYRVVAYTLPHSAPLSVEFAATITRCARPFPCFKSGSGELIADRWRFFVTGPD